MPRDHKRSPDDHVPAPMMQGRPVERESVGEDPLLAAARWTLQGSEPEPEDDED